MDKAIRIFMTCTCGSSLNFSSCCEPIITGEKKAATAEQLMRARYSSYVAGNIDFLEKSLAPESRTDFDKASTKKWAQQTEWKSLQIMSVDKGGENDSKGTVEFMATYKVDGEGLEHHEVSTFRKDKDGNWYFIDGESHTHKEGEGHHHHHEKPVTVVREQPKIGRNDPCTCGSGKKYKKCCGAIGPEA